MLDRLSANDDSLVSELLLDWEETLEAGSRRTAEQICGDRHDLVDELNRRIAALAKIDRILFHVRTTIESDESGVNDSAAATAVPYIPGYRIVGEIGRGGMGIVFKAVQIQLNRVVAIKIIRDGRWVSPLQIARFKSEAEILAKLRLPGVVQIYDILECDGVLCLILEFVEGKSLREFSCQIETSASSAAEIIREITATLAKVHARGVLHRDIKPANILIDSDGQVKISDFGLAKELLADSNGTMTGDVFGSPSYMAPEQANGNLALLSAKTDIYAIGATLYELLTARPPFAGATVIDTLAQVKTQEPIAPRSIVRSIPRDLETICLKCLEKESDQRYASASLLLEDLDRFIDGFPVLARPVSHWEHLVRWCRRNPDKALSSCLSLLAVLTLAAVLIWFSERLASVKAESKLHQVALQAEEARSSTQEFYARYGQIRERGLSRPSGWSLTNLDAIENLAKLATTDQSHQMLRTEALRCICSYDLRKAKTLLTGDNISRLSHHPTQPVLVMGCNQPSDDGSVAIRLFDTNTYRERAALSFPVGPEIPRQKIDGVRSIAFTPSGDKLVVGSRRGWIHIWETGNWQRIDSWQAHADWVIGLSVDPSGEKVFSTSSDGEVKEWKIAGHGLSRQTKVEGEVHGLCLTKRCLVIASNEGTIIDLQNFSSLKLPRDWMQDMTAIASTLGETGVLAAHQRRLTQVEVDANCGAECVIRNLDDPRLQRAHQNFIRSIASSPCGRFAVSADNTSAKLWDAVSGALIGSVNLGEEGGTAATFLSDANRFVISGHGRVELYEIIQHPGWTAMPLNTRPLRDIAFAKRQPILVQMSLPFPNGTNWDNELQSQNFDTGEICRVSQIDVDGELTFSDNHGVIVSSTTNSLRVFHGPASSRFREIACANSARSLKLSQDESQLYYVADDGLLSAKRKPASAIFVCDLQTGATKTLWSNRNSEINSNSGKLLAIGLSGSWVVTSSEDGLLRVHLANDGKVVATIPVTSNVTSLHGTIDGHLFTGDDRGRIRVLNLPNGTVVDEQSEHSEEIRGLGVIERAAIVISACRGSEVRFWKWSSSLQQLKLHAVIGPFGGSIERLSISGDGNALALLIEGESAARVLRFGPIRETMKRLDLRW